MDQRNVASLAAGAGGICLVALAAFLAGRFLAGAGASWLALGLILAAAIAVAWLRWRNATAELRRVEEHARALVETDWQSAQGRTTLSPDPAGRRAEGAFARVHGLLDDLGTRLTSQLKDVARKSRNLESLIGALDEPVLATDSEDRILLSNRAAEAMLDAEPDGLVGRPLREVITQESLLEHHALARRGEIRRGRVQLATALGLRTFQVSASPVPAAWGGGVFGVVLLLRDVTELDKAVQVRTDFVANASHELRTPVAAIKAAAETLSLVDPGDQEQTTRLTQMIDAHASRLEEMLRDLMDLSRLESDGVALHFAPIALSDLTETLQSLFEQVCRARSITLRFELEPDLEGFVTDKRLLLLGLRNLVDNASRFAREGTAVRIAGALLELRDDTRPPIVSEAAMEALRPCQRHGVVRFEVIDKGPGIPLEHQGRVFERYYQVEPARSGRGAAGAHKPRRGTGLGLSIVKHAARALGGTVGLESVWGQGTTVWLEIPVGFGQGADGAAPPAQETGR